MQRSASHRTDIFLDSITLKISDSAIREKNLPPLLTALNGGGQVIKLSMLWVDGEVYRKPAPLAELAFNIESALMGIDDCFCDAQPETGAGNIAA